MVTGDILSDVWAVVTDGYDAFKQGLSEWEAYANIEKALERELVYYVYAPLKRRDRDNLKKEFDTNFESIAESTKSLTSSVSFQVDLEIKGEFSTAIQTQMQAKNSKWDKL